MSSSTVCVDASFIARLFLGPDDAKYWAILDSWCAEQKSIYAPALIAYELANAFYRLQRAGRISLPAAELALDGALGLPVRLANDTDLHRAALRIASDTELPATYDAHYLALAEGLDAELWTADAELAHAVTQAGRAGPTVRVPE